MIAPLRRWHRWSFVLLAFVLPVVVALAVSHRPGLPEADSGGDGPSASDLVIPAPSPAIGQTPVTVMLGSGIAEGEPFEGVVRRYRQVIELEIGTPLRHPDVLAYWIDPGVGSQGQDVLGSSSGVPAEAFLLGPVTALEVNRYALPEGAEGLPGQLLLYSLGHQARLSAVAVGAGSAGDPSPADPADPATAVPANTAPAGTAIDGTATDPAPDPAPEAAVAAPAGGAS